MSRSLKTRVEKLEDQTGGRETERPIDPEYAEYRAFLLSKGFLTEIFEKARTMLLTMPGDDARRLFVHCSNVENFRKREHRHVADHPQIGRVTGYFFKLLKLSLEGEYIGPLALPAVIADFWREYRTSQSEVNVAGVDCEDCGYVIPPYEQFGCKKYVNYADQWNREFRYADMRCVLCGGKAGPDAYHSKHPDLIPAWYDHPERDRIRKAKLPFTYHHTHIDTWDLMIMVRIMLEPKDEHQSAH